jgi:hypothetical protein
MQLCFTWRNRYQHPEGVIFMRTLQQITLLFGLSIALFATAAAQQTNVVSQESSPNITAGVSQERVRFTAPSSTVQIHLQVFDNSGQMICDVTSQGNVLDWLPQQASGARLAAGSYLAMVTAKSVSGKLSRRMGSISVAENQVELQPIAAAQLPLAQQQAVASIDDVGALGVRKAGDSEAITLIAHNGSEGQTIRSRGAFSFRIGDFFSGTDTEQMRLTEDGRLGIGTSTPRATLDVAGTIRAERVLIAKSKPVSGNATTADTTDSVQSLVSGTGTQNRIVKWTDNAGGLGDTTITETDTGFIGIGTTSPDSQLNIQGNIPVLLGHLGVIRTTGSNNGFGLLMDSAGSGNNNVGLAVSGVPKGSFAFDVARQFMGFVNLGYSPNDFSLRLNSNGSLTYHDSVNSAERFRITNTGKVGIGTNNPNSLLDVAGDINVSGNAVIAGNIAAKYQDVAEWVPTRKLMAAGTLVSIDPQLPNSVMASNRAYDTRVAGVISAKPGVILGEAGPDKVLVATTGRVKVRVDATRNPIQIGDLLVASEKPGVAMKSLPIKVRGLRIHRPGTIIGKALEPLSTGVGEIFVLLTLQ